MRRAAAGVAAVLALAAALSALALTRPDPQVQAVADGCGRDDAAAIKNLVPEWAYVNDKDTSPTGPPPPPQWAEGVVRANGGLPTAVHTAGGDIPTTHDSYDVNLELLPDPAYAFLMGGVPERATGNFAGEEAETGRLHSELEELAFPRFAWPEPGDRVRLLGSWVWDCGHWQPGGERTELHPIRAVWVERRPSPRSPLGENEGDVLITTDKTGAGRVADCSHKTRALGHGDALKACIAREPNWQDVSGEYRFSLPLPPRPAGATRARVRVVDAGSTAGAPPLRARLANGRVEVSLTIVPGMTAGLRRLVVARRVLAGWTPARRARPEHLRVRFERLLIRRAMDPGCPPDQPGCPYRNETTNLGQLAKLPGEWNVYWDVGGIWGMWNPRALLVRRDGQSFRGRQTVDVYVPRRRPWRVFVWPRECDFGALGSMDDPKRPLWPCPPNDEFGPRSGDDVPGPLEVRFRSPAAAHGVHRANGRAGVAGSTCPATNRNGCYEVTFRVTRVRRR